VYYWLNVNELGIMMIITSIFNGKVIHFGNFDSMKELVLDAIEKGVDLSGANLGGVDLSGVDFRDSVLWGVDFCGSDLSGVNLRGANIRNTDLRNADLSGVDLRNCAGNRNQIKSIFISEIYSITYTSEYLQIGCESHLIKDWWKFDDERIKAMDGDKALNFWAESKSFIKKAIKLFPATPTNHEESKN
jgi:hypothetical protein